MLQTDNQMEIPDSLKRFLENNTSIVPETVKDKILLKKPWNDESIHLLFEKSIDFTIVKDIVLPEELVAIYHKDKSVLEIIAGPIFKENPLIKKSFDFIYQGASFKCNSDKSSSQLEFIARNFVIAETFTYSYHRNLPMLRDYYFKRMPKRFIEDSIPISFYVSGDFNKINYEYVNLLKHLNFYMSYFDRDSPTIIILDRRDGLAKFKTPCLFQMTNTFPDKINSLIIDPVLLDIFTVAQDTRDIRLKFIFYYQILEYSSYYYLNYKVRNKLTSTLKSPDFTYKIDEYLKSIVDDLKDHFTQRDDYQKLEQTVTDYCTIDDVKYEIECNWEYFAEDQEFDGGFKLPKVIKDKNSLDNMIDSDLLKFVKNIDRIRNVIVHLRESRENKVILPTQRNNYLLSPYLFILRRIAEKVAMRFN